MCGHVGRFILYWKTTTVYNSKRNGFLWAMMNTHTEGKVIRCRLPVIVFIIDVYFVRFYDVILGPDEVMQRRRNCDPRFLRRTNVELLVISESTPRDRRTDKRIGDRGG